MYSEESNSEPSNHPVYPAWFLEYTKGAAPKKKSRLRKIRNLGSLPKTYVVNLAGAAGIFERWMWARYELREEPAAESLDPETLDVYLEDFFSTIKRPSGEEYRRGTLESMRFKIERYLRETGYPHSIVSSPVFVRSRLAYKQRMASLP